MNRRMHAYVLVRSGLEEDNVGLGIECISHVVSQEKWRDAEAKNAATNAASSAAKKRRVRLGSQDNTTSQGSTSGGGLDRRGQT